MEMEDRYLGDGVYASFDGYQIWVDTRMEGACKIALEPEVLIRLVQYHEDIKARAKGD